MIRNSGTIVTSSGSIIVLRIRMNSTPAPEVAELGQAVAGERAEQQVAQRDGDGDDSRC